MASRDIVVVGGSAGGLEALLGVVGGIGAGAQLTLLVAIHRGPHTPGALPHILARAGATTVSYAGDGDAIRRGHIFVAPPDHHLLVSGEQLRVTRGPTEHGFRPAIDPLFRTAAREHGPRVVGWFCRAASTTARSAWPS
jgi:two-component system, chemotaxis family, protein-glutamate methylesterase/glutaminase